MKVRPWAVFTADFPDDMIEEDGEIIQYPGQAVTTAIAEMFARLGCEVSAPMHAYEHGWELEVDREKRAHWCQISDDGDSVYLVFKDSSVFAPIFPPHPEYIGILKELNDELSRDSRFHNVKWFRVPESGEGHPTPAS